jgi:hypothetical protein
MMLSIVETIAIASFFAAMSAQIFILLNRDHLTD